MKAIRLWLSGLLAMPSAAFAQTDTDAPKREPHPTMVAFLAELENGELERAAKRIASVNGLLGRSTAYVYFPQGDLVRLLATCKLRQRRTVRTAVTTERTEWKCPGGKRYSMIFVAAGDAPNPYLHVDKIETDESRAAREAETARRLASGEWPPPPPALKLVSAPEEVAALEERRRLEALEAAEKRDLVGKAVLSGDVSPIADFVTPKTDSGYITHDLYFDVKIRHINGIGWSDLDEVFRRAFDELGKPTKVHCYRPERRWAPQVCEWQMGDGDNTMRAEMNFAGEGGSMNSIRVYRETPEEAEQLSQQAIDLGVIED